MISTYFISIVLFKKIESKKSNVFLKNLKLKNQKRKNQIKKGGNENKKERKLSKRY